MRLFLDQGVPRRTAAILREAGVDTVHAGEVGLSTAQDSDIVTWCRANEAVVVTLDADFHAQIALSGETSPSAIRFRLQAVRAPELARFLLEIIETRRDDLDAGALLSVRRSRLRIRRLPVGRGAR